MHNEQKRIVVEILKDIIRGYRFDSSVGLCANIYDQSLVLGIPVHGSELSDYFEAWPKYSGVAKFPVQSPERLSPEAQYWKSHNMYCGEYGLLRLELAQFIIESLEKDYEEQYTTPIQA